MKIYSVIALFLISSISYASSKQELNCHSAAFKVKATMSGYTLSNIEVKGLDNIWNSIGISTSIKSYDMFQSQKFSPVLPYPVYSLNENKNEKCSYLLALPGGDMRDYQFTGLLFLGGKCFQEEIELNCSTRSL